MNNEEQEPKFYSNERAEQSDEEEKKSQEHSDVDKEEPIEVAADSKDESMQDYTMTPGEGPMMEKYKKKVRP